MDAEALRQSPREPGSLVSSVILGLWIALIGADRIDLFGGSGPFVFTPFLALTPVVVLSEVLRRLIVGRSVLLARRSLVYAAGALGLVSIALASVYVAQIFPVSAARALLLTADVVGTFVVALLVSDRRDLVRVLARGAAFSLLLYVAFDVAEALWWIGRGPDIMRIGSLTASFGTLANAGPIPRLAGPVVDGNRGAFVLLFYFVVISAGEPRAWLRRSALVLAGLVFVAAGSRSATLGALAMMTMFVLTYQRLPSARALLGGALLVACVSAFFLARPRALDQLGRALNPVAARVSTKEGSGPEHLKLIGRGLEEGSASVPRAALGMGYGMSYLALQDVFPGNRYGNFHSMFVTMFAEAGFGALAILLVLMGTPVLIGGPLRLMVAGAFGFDLFYQTNTEPVFWFALALAWLGMRVAGRPSPYGAFTTWNTTSVEPPLVTVNPSTKLDPAPLATE